MAVKQQQTCCPLQLTSISFKLGNAFDRGSDCLENKNKKQIGFDYWNNDSFSLNLVVMVSFQPK